MVSSLEYVANSEGNLLRVKDIGPVSLEQLIKHLKPRLTEDEVREFAEFLKPIIRLDPDTRPPASELLKHPWLKTGSRKRKSWWFW